MYSLLDISSNRQAFNKYIKPLLNIELLLALYILLFIFGFTTQEGYLFYNEYRAIQIVLLLFFSFLTCFCERNNITKSELAFFMLIAIGSLFWESPAFVITELLLLYLLYKSFNILQYRELISKILVIMSLTMFIQFPLSLWDYIQTGSYAAIWYPLTWNIRVYNSYFLLVSIFATWFYVTNQAYRFLYLLFLFLAFLAILLDGGRSSTIAYTLLIAGVSMGYGSVRLALSLTYIISWLSYLLITYIASLDSGTSTLLITRESSSGRIDLWINALKCWLQHPVMGCGFYQLQQYPSLSAHPHNVFIQILSETGLLGFAFLLYIMFVIIRRINWSKPQRYFVGAAFLAIAVDMSFSGVHIYPVTQVVLLWLLVFLLKNPEFVTIYQVPLQSKSLIMSTLPSLFYIVISLWFIDLLMTTEVFLSKVPFTPPRFWVYGYRL